MSCFNRRLPEACPQRRTLARLALAGTTLVFALAACGGGSGDPADVNDSSEPAGTDPPALTDSATASGPDGEGDTASTTPAGAPLEPTASTRLAPLEIKGHLEEGANGDSVERLQEALAALGFSPGLTDGSYGPMTKTAVGAFQRAQGLKADGIANEETVAAINRALQERG